MICMKVAYDMHEIVQAHFINKVDLYRLMIFRTEIEKKEK